MLQPAVTALRQHSYEEARDEELASLLAELSGDKQCGDQAVLALKLLKSTE